MMASGFRDDYFAYLQRLDFSEIKVKLKENVENRAYLQKTYPNSGILVVEIGLKAPFFFSRLYLCSSSR